VKKRSITIAGHATSLTLEDAFWDALKAISVAKGCSIASLIKEIDSLNTERLNLSSCVRVYILTYFRARADLNGGS
jgi:predicted DNA-binding ribbon-helix-helix protein